MNYTDEDIARVVHAANGALQAIQGDPAPQVPWESFDRRQVVINGVREAREGASARDLHATWVTRLEADGWTFGEIKDPDAKTHPCLVPYDRLPEGQRDKDRLLFVIVRALAP